MSIQVKEIQTLNLAEMKKLSFINVNGTVYFAEVKITEDVFEVKNAIVVTENESTITAMVKKWAIAQNKGELRNPVMGGNIAYNQEPLNDSQVAELEQIVATINNNLKGALTSIATGIISSL